MPIVEDITIMLRAFGEEVTYTPGGGGSAKTVTAIVNTNFPNQEDNDGHGILFAVATITVSSDDVSPHYRDKFTARGHDWLMDTDGWGESKLNQNSTEVYSGNLKRLLS